jgi:hypothetical protein
VSYALHVESKHPEIVVLGVGALDGVQNNRLRDAC